MIFFYDIFRSSSGSSPAECKPFATSVGPDFSLLEKMTKDVDIPVFGSNMHTPNTPLSRFSSTSTQILRTISGQSSGKTVLSRASSSVKESVYSTRSTENETEKKSNLRAESPSNEFHFSIHKWANLGGPSLLSLCGSKHVTSKGSSKVSALSVDDMQDSGFPDEYLSAKKQITDHVFGISLPEAIEKEKLAVKQEVNEHEVMPPSSLLHDEFERKGYEEAGTKANMDDVSSKKKFESRKMNAGKNRVKGMVRSFFKMYNQESPLKTKRNVSSRRKSRERKRIQDEVDDIISNLDTNVETMTDALRTTELASELPAESLKMALDASTTVSSDSKVPADDVDKMPGASFMAKEESERSNKQRLAQNRTIRRLKDINFQQDASPASKWVLYGSKATVEIVDDPSLDDFQVEELIPVEDKLPKTQESEAIMALDSKIHLWSSGRTGNIRSLLSTLQLVLWAESGWKPVPLVDIIEANAVRKAYNRAMLCLHPDKLQQRGADSDKKYIAEKVLDILQEAWDHFSSLGGTLLPSVNKTMWAA